MPRPIQNYHSVRFDAAYALQERPGLMAHVGTVVVLWAEIDLELGSLLAELLGSDAELGMEIYLSLRSDGPRNEVFNAIALKRLTEEWSARLTTILKDVREAARRRNAVAHGIWGVSPDHPDAIIHMEYRDYLRCYSAYPRPLLGYALEEQFSKLQRIAYKEKDFKEIEEHLIRQLTRIRELSKDYLDGRFDLQS